MDSEYCLQDVVRCQLCETHVPSSHCVVCITHLCQACERNHSLDRSKEHYIVSFTRRRLTPKCQIHSTTVCEFYCEQCDLAICKQCASSSEHKDHKFVDILKTYESKMTAIKRDLQELEKFIYPQCQQIASSNPIHQDHLKKDAQKLKSTLENISDELHKEINSITQKLKYDIQEIDAKCLMALNKQGYEKAHIMSDIRETISDLKENQDFNDIHYLFGYKSRNAEFKTTLAKVPATIQYVVPKKIIKEKIDLLMGSLLDLSIKIKEHGYFSDIFSSTDKSLADKSQIIADISTEYGPNIGLRSVSCCNDEDIWTCGDDNIMRLYNFQKKLIKSIQTKSGNKPWDISVARSGDLIYTDLIDRSVNIVQNADIHEVIKLRDWRPRNVCSTSSGDLLVIMVSDYDKETKVVRFSGTKEEQSIQFNDKGEPLYSGGLFSVIKFICQNKNEDICVSDKDANAIVVVSRVGKLRFTYTGTPSNTKAPFDPRGITSDSQCRILIADFSSSLIHILGQDGQFLRYIEECQLDMPWGLCVDTKDNLIVAEYKTGKLKKIQYYM